MCNNKSWFIRGYFPSVFGVRAVYVFLLTAFFLLFCPVGAFAAGAIPFTVNMSEAVNVDTSGGTPRIAVDVGGVTRYATYASGTGTGTLTFHYTLQAGDVDLDGVVLSSPVDLNGGTFTDLNGNALSPLTFTLPNTSGVKIDYPSLLMDFAGSDYILSGTHYASLPAFLTAAGGTFTRASVGTYFDSSGDLQTAASGQPRFDYDPVTHVPKGILIEELRTNYVQNGQFSGITPGVYTNLTSNHWRFGVPAVMPGSVVTVTGVGTVNGLSYIDLLYNLTTNSSGSNAYASLSMPSADQFAVVPGDDTVVSAWMGVTSYSSVGGSCAVALSNRSYTAGGVYLAETNKSYSSVTPFALQIAAKLTHGATAAKSYSSMYIRIPNGGSCDLSIRVAGYQMERGAFPTSYIPTTNGTVTRQADILTIPTGGWFNAAAGALTAQSVIPYVGGSSYPRIAEIGDGSSNNRLSLTVNDAVADARAESIFTGGASQFGYSIGAYTAGNTLRQGLVYAPNDAIAATDGTLGSVDTSVTLPSVDKLIVGGNSSGNNNLNGTVNKLKYYPARVAGTQLQLLTQ